MIETGWYSNPGAGTETPEIPVLELFKKTLDKPLYKRSNHVFVAEQKDQPLLSVLIPTVISRKKKFVELVSMLNAQRAALPMPDRVEILTLSDNGELMVGAKRNKLLEMATGEYVCFFDDDDVPMGNYITLILEALETRPDVVGIGIIWLDNYFDSIRLLIRSLDYKWTHWMIREGNNSITCGRPAHLNPTRRSIAITEKFPENCTAGEDADWSARISPKLKTCVNIDQPIYCYLFMKDGTITQRPGAREAMRAELPAGHQWAYRDKKIVELDDKGRVVIRD